MKRLMMFALVALLSLGVASTSFAQGQAATGQGAAAGQTGGKATKKKQHKKSHKKSKKKQGQEAGSAK